MVLKKTNSYVHLHTNNKKGNYSEGQFEKCQIYRMAKKENFHA